MRILIVNAILIGDNNATGITMRNMLYNMDDVGFLQYCIDYRIANHEQLVPTIFMDVNDAKIDAVIKRRRDRAVGNSVKLSAVTLTRSNTKNAVGELLHGIVDSWPSRVSQQNMCEITKFHPDLIYTMGGGIRVINQAIQLAKKLKIPVVFHCMDDWKSTIYTTSLLSTCFNKLINRKTKELHKYTSKNLAICEKMAIYYSSLFNKEYSYASNCVFTFAADKYTPHNSVTMQIIFSGGLHFGRGETLFEVGEIIDQLNSENYHIELAIFAPPMQVRVFSSIFSKLKNTVLLPYVAKEKQLENLMKADILLHVESFDRKNILYMQYSFSTKLVEYFAAGRAVLAYGKRQMSSLQYIESMKCGYIAENKVELKASLIDAYNNVKQRTAYAEEALKVAKKYHTQDVIQQRIRSIFMDNIQNGAKSGCI